MFPFYYEHRDQGIYLKEQSAVHCKPHLHRHVEMILVAEGTVSATVDATEVTLGAGDVLFVFPNQVHAYTDIDPKRVFLLIFPPDIVHAYSATLHKYQPASPLLSGGFCLPRVEAVLSAMLAERAEAKQEVEVRLAGYLTVLLGTLLPHVTLQKLKTEGRELLSQVLIYCMEHYKEELTLSRVADALHISKYYISHMLSNRLHMRFNAYLNAIRISEAMSMLATTDLAITEVALASGFDCLRTFDRAFHAHTGMSPRAYRGILQQEKQQAYIQKTEKDETS